MSAGATKTPPSTPVVGFWTLDRIAAALDSEARNDGAPHPRGPMPIGRVSTDTRTIQPGDLFVALAGEHHDAHTFLGQAVQAGASAVVVRNARHATGLGVPAFEVRDTTQALGALARYRRRAWGKPVIAVGGSNGKTSTKELVRAALGGRLEVHATAGNLNNQVGVPLTLLAVPDFADVAVVEVGTNTPGEVALLRDIALPDIAIVTTVQEEHLEGFGDLAGVMREEASLMDGVVVAIVPAGEAALVAEARGRAQAVVTAGLESGDVASSWHELLLDGTGRIRIGADARASIPLRGEHNLRNAMLAFAAARACGVGYEDAARGLSTLDPSTVPGMRSAVTPLGAALLVNDAYNANPASALAALALLATVAGERQQVIVLGTMRELGAHAARAHREVARAALNTDADVIAGIGDFAAALQEAGRDDPRVVTARDVDDLWPSLRGRLDEDAAILLKASRGVRLERLVPLLTEWSDEEPSPYRDA